MLFETFAVLAALVAGCVFRSRRWPAATRVALSRLASRPWQAIAIVGLLSVAANLGVAAHLEPSPTIHDEFSYLLAGDTYAQGRITNPTHPLWRHFETIHVIHQPSYASKYLPAQGLFLAAGEILTGRPWIGVLISVALATMALCWMLQAWLPPGWAFLGGLLAAVHPGLVLRFGQSFWGGAVAMLGGALLYGAFRRLYIRPRASCAWVMGLGLALLATSRPFEGLIASLPVAAAILTLPFGSRRLAVPLVFRRVALPLATSVLAIVAVIGFYNFRVTGDALLLPYQVHEQTYAAAPVFLWQPARTMPDVRHGILEALHGDWSMNEYNKQQTAEGFWREAKKKLRLLVGFYPRTLLGVPLLFVFLLLRNPWIRFALLCCGLMLAALLTETFFQVHYAAPLAPLFFFVAMQALRVFRTLHWRGRRLGAPLAAASFWILLVALAETTISREESKGREEVVAWLEAIEGQHLVLVYHRPSHFAHSDFVYNPADIDSARIVWARPLGETENTELVEYFAGRRVWLLDPDAERVVLLPWADGPPPSSYLDWPH